MITRQVNKTHRWQLANLGPTPIQSQVRSGLLHLRWSAFSSNSWTVKIWSAFSRYSWTVKIWSRSRWPPFEHSGTKMGNPNNEPLYSTLCLSIISTCSTSKFHLKMSQCSAWGVVMPMANLYAKDCTVRTNTLWANGFGFATMTGLQRLCGLSPLPSDGSKVLLEHLGMCQLCKRSISPAGGHVSFRIRVLIHLEW